ncbi:MAG: transcription antitermination factor NusB [Pseudomonadota bacterium]|nr:transcription antitermination factor NusB [Pseudomonadota bacterium]
MGKSKKSSSRLFAVQILYEMEINGKSFEIIQKRFEEESFFEIEKINDLGAPSKAYIEILVKGVSNHQDKVDNIIKDNLVNWSLPRINSLARAILRTSVFELLDVNDVPNKVVFNEYIEIAKFFFDGDEPSFINAVLDSVSKNYKGL